jgi:hypothetical protein
MTLTEAAPPAGATSPPTAADLAARIAVPRQLPPRYDGQPLRHLSHSSYTRFLLCPEDWRRWYLIGERPAPSGAMFLGRCVDATLTTYYRQLIDHGEALATDQVNDAYRHTWQSELAVEHAKRGVHWEPELPAAEAFKLGLEALELTFAELVPRLGRPVAVQRRLEFALAPELEWSVQCHLDLETLRGDELGETSPAVVDYKVKAASSPRPRQTATRRPASTSRDAGSKAGPRTSSRSRRSPSPASSASR